MKYKLTLTTLDGMVLDQSLVTVSGLSEFEVKPGVYNLASPIDALELVEDLRTEINKANSAELGKLLQNIRTKD